MNLKRKALERILIYSSLIFPLFSLFTIVRREIFLLSVILLILSLFLEKRERYLPRFLINLFGISFILLFFFTVNLSNFLENALSTLLLLLTLKFLEEKRLRDYFQIYLLEFLILCGASFYYAGIFFFGVMLFGFIFFCYALFIHLYVDEGEVSVITSEEIKGILFTFGGLLFASLFLSAVFFVGLPRLQFPLFNIGPEREKAKTGFTDKIRLGAFSEIQESSAPVLRAIFEENLKPDPKSLYFRVIAFDYFDGKVWKRTFEEEKETLWKLPKSPLKRVIIYLLTDQDSYLPLPEGAKFVRASFPVKKYNDGIFKSEEPLNYPVKYEGFFSEKSDVAFHEHNFERYLQVPEVSEKVKELARRLKGRNNEETLENILNYFLRENFQYSLSKLPLGEKPLERFLFETKRGNCEYFAGATALLLRLNGIPSRVIGGYKGAIYHSRGNYYLVQERFAHSWVEAFLDGKWIRIDPSPGFSFESFFKRGGLLEKIRLYYDLLNHYYTKLILDFDYRKQKGLYESLRGRFFLPKKESLLKDFDLKLSKGEKFTLLWVLGFILGFVIFLRYKRVLFEPKEKKLLKRFLKELEKRGYVKDKNEGLFEFAERIEDKPLREIVLKFARIYGEYYYRDISFDKRGLKELSQCLKELQNLN